MKKRLLMMAFAVLSVASSFAYEVNEYAYTATQRVKILSEDLLGWNFSNGLEGWTNAAGDTPNADVWSIEPGSGPVGENVVMSASGSTADAALCRSTKVEDGVTYLVTYDIIGTTTAATGIFSGGSSCIDIFLTSTEGLTKAEGDVDVSTVDGYKDEWKTNSYVFTATGEQSLVVHLEKLATGTKFTNVKLYRAQLCFDDRIIQNKLAYADRLIATGKFALDTENGFVGNVVEAMRGMLGTEELDDLSNGQGLVDAYEEELLKWLDLNAADMLKDEKRWSAYGDTRKANAWGTWTGGGGRWFHKNNGGSNEITEDGDEIGHRFQGGVEGNAYMAYPLTPANAGTYMFSVDVVGHYMAGGKSNKNYLSGTGDNYVTDWNRDFKGVTVYAGKDQMMDNAEANATMNTEQEGQKVDCGIISNPNAKLNPQKFVVFYEVTQEMVDAGEKIWFGMTYILDPDRGVSNMGSNVNIANPQIRLIGVTQDLIDYQNEVAKIITQQGPLKDRLQYANEDMQKTAADGYPWGKADLQAAIDKYQPVYDASLEVIDADGNVKNQTFIQQAMEEAAQGTGILYSDSLLHSVQAMNSARSTFSRTNALTAVTYLQKIADAQAVYDDLMYGAGDKATFQAAINAAKDKRTEVLAATTDETREADIETLNAQLAALLEATAAYKASANLQAAIDIDFTNRFEQDSEGNYIIKGIGGEMNFGVNANPENNNVDKEISYALGCGEEMLDVLRVGNSEAFVTLSEAAQAGDNEVIRFEFDMWFLRLSGKSVVIDLRNEANQRVAGFSFDKYDSAVGYNDFNNEANEGADLVKYVVGNTAGDVASVTDANKTSFALVINNKEKTAQGIIVSPEGTCTGKPIPFRTNVDETTTLDDTKITKFVLSSNYATYQGRRCWFDNFKVFKYAAGESSGISEISSEVSNAAIYDLSGRRVNKAVKGVYIQNGKKFVVK